jgi:hypothetical protein
MRLKSLLIGTLAVLVVGVGAAWSVGSKSDRWPWDLAPKVSGYVPDPKDINFYYPLPEVVEFTSPFGYRTHPLYGDRRLHAGVDLGAPEGMPVLAAHSGYVRYADWEGGYGKMVIVEYADGQYQTLYAHLSEILVRAGDAVRPRQVIGKVGSTGGVTGPHLHFELLRKEGSEFTPIDPGNQVKAVEAYVAVRPPDPGQSATAPGVAAKPAEAKPKAAQPWAAPALDSAAKSAAATLPFAASGAIAEENSPSPPNQNIILDFNP